MKPGEDPREFGRRRDVWLMPHSLKVAARMLMFEFEERACGDTVPASQSGFTKQANASAQTINVLNIVSTRMCRGEGYRWCVDSLQQQQQQLLRVPRG